MTVSVCIPMYNEIGCAEGSAASLYDKMKSLESQKGISFEIVFCDDGSTDGCGDALRAFASDKPEITVTGYPDNRGKGHAVKRAILESRGDVAVFTDCDLAYGVDVIEKALERFEEEDAPDVLVGSRNLDPSGYAGYGALRRFASRVYIKVLSFVGGLDLTDSQCGFKAFDGESAKTIFSYCECDGFAFDYEVIMIARRRGMKISEMPVSIVNHGKSSVRVVRDSVKMVRDILKIKRRVRRLDIAAK